MVMGHVTGFCLRNASFASWHSCANSTRTRVQARYELNQPPCTIQAAALGQASGASRAWPTSTTATGGPFPPRGAAGSAGHQRPMWESWFTRGGGSWRTAPWRPGCSSR